MMNWKALIDENGVAIIPEGVMVIDKNAYKDITELYGVIIPNTVTEIRRDAFAGCIGLTYVEIPNTVTIIGDYAFEGCSGIESIEIPDSVKEIGEGAFSECSGLLSIEIPDSVLEIGEGVFSCCKGLTSVEIPSSISTIANGSFYGCSGLEYVKIHDGVSGIGCTEFKEYERGVFEECSRLTRIDLPDSVKEIGKSAFEGCTGLSIIDIPDSVSKIGEGAFRGCKGLTFVEIPIGISTIPNATFSDCTGLADVKMHDGISSIGSTDLVYRYEQGAFERCYALTCIHIPNSVRFLGFRAFRGCTGLSTIDIPNSISEIGEEVFIGCSGLTSIEIPGSIMKITNGSFAGCTRLTDVFIREGVLSIGNEARDGSKAFGVFQDCSSLVNVDIPDSVTEIGYMAFAHCQSLKSIKLPDSLKEIDDYAFKGCSFVSIRIPESVSGIGEDAFADCSSLQEVIFNGATYMHNYSFTNCDTVQSIWIKDDGIKYGFERPGCAISGSCLSEIHIHEKNPEDVCDIINDLLYDSADDQVTLFVPVGTGYAYRHFGFARLLKEVVIEKESAWDEIELIQADNNNYRSHISKYDNKTHLVKNDDVNNRLVDLLDIDFTDVQVISPGGQRENIQKGISKDVTSMLKGWEKVERIPFYHFYWYYPTNKFTSEELSNDSVAARTIVYNFKDGRHHTTVKHLVMKKIQDTFKGVDLSEFAFVCIPASTVEVNNSRYRAFSAEVCDGVGMRNGFEHISITKEKTASHLGGTDTAEYSYDGQFFKGRNVILFDDIVTRGRSMIEMKASLERLGAKVICAMSIGRTFSDWKGNTPKPHPYTGTL